MKTLWRILGWIMVAEIDYGMRPMRVEWWWNRWTKQSVKRVKAVDVDEWN